MWKDNGLQLVMLPTENKTMLFRDSEVIYTTCELGLPKFDRLISPSLEGLYLYLLSDEEIKIGDIFLTNEGSIETATGMYGNCPYDLINEVGGQYKVISSTDPSLNIPTFTESFLEEYVKRYNSKKSLEVDCNEVIDNAISIQFKEEKCITPIIKYTFGGEKMYTLAQMEMRLFEGIAHAISYPETFITGICLDSTKTKNWIKENLK